MSTLWLASESAWQRIARAAWRRRPEWSRERRCRGQPGDLTENDGHNDDAHQRLMSAQPPPPRSACSAPSRPEGENQEQLAVMETSRASNFSRRVRFKDQFEVLPFKARLRTWSFHKLLAKTSLRLMMYRSTTMPLTPVASQ